MTFQEEVRAALLDLAPREKEHNGVSRSNEIFVDILARRLAEAVDAIIETDSPGWLRLQRGSFLLRLRGEG